jgi:hypothetical protein
MPLFTLTDIEFRTPAQRKGVKQLTEETKKLNLLRYPLDLGSADKGHYMVININEQIKTSFPNKLSDIDPTILVNRNILSKNFGNFTTNQNISSVLDAGEKLFEKIGEAISQTSVGSSILKQFSTITDNSSLNSISELATVGYNQFKQNNENFGLRTIRRITDAVAFYMPDTLNFQYNQNYDNVNPGNQLAGQVLAAGTSAASSISRGDDPANILKTLSPFAAKLASSIVGGDVGRILFTAGTGGVVSNPMLDIIYSSPSFRNFRFDFLMYPRSQNEAVEINKIIETLRFHQAPELVKGVGGAFLYPPSEFDISFYYNGKINPNIPKISTCVLSSIDVDYVPTGSFSAYEVPSQPTPFFGGTGMPVAIRLTLAFTETEYLVKGNPILSERTSTQDYTAASQRGEYGTS